MDEIPGLSRYVTKDGIRVTKCHYSADPDKNIDTPKGLDWFYKSVKGYPGGQAGLKWQREMEINFQLSGSARLWPNFTDKMQPRITCDPLDVPEHWPIWCGYDYGSYNPFAFNAYAWETEEKIYQIDEIYKAGCPLHEQAKLIRERPYFSRIQGIIGDPSIWLNNQQRDGLDPISIGDIFDHEYDIHIQKGIKDKASDLWLRDLLNARLWRDLKAPRLIIFNTCTNILSELRKLRVKEWKTRQSREDNNTPEEIVAKDNHAWDAMKYVLLARQHEAPDELGPVPGTFGWYRQQIIQRKRREAMVLS